MSKRNIYIPKSNTRINKRGYWMPSYVDSRKLIKFNNNGKAKGYLMKSYVDPRRNVFTKIK